MDSITFAKAMADETRQEIMRLLCCQWLCVGDVVDKLGQCQPANGLAPSGRTARCRPGSHARREGRQVFYSLNQDAVARLLRHTDGELCSRTTANYHPRNRREVVFLTRHIDAYRFKEMVQ